MTETRRGRSAGGNASRMRATSAWRSEIETQNLDALVVVDDVVELLARARRVRG